MSSKPKHASKDENAEKTVSTGWRVVNALATFVAAVTLTVTLIAAGFAVDAAVPLTTDLLAEAFSGSTNPDTPFSHDELVLAAGVTRDYTVADNDLDALYEMLHEINESAGTPYADATDEELAAADEAYTLDAEAISHLDDVYQVVTIARNVLIVVAVLAVAACAHVGIRKGRRSLGRVMTFSGVVVLALFVALGIWVAVDFNGFFAVFHSLFFSEGSWYFASDSLLITMYPTNFWIGMGAVWLVVSCVLAVLALVIGHKLRKRKKEE